MVPQGAKAGLLPDDGQAASNPKVRVADQLPSDEAIRGCHCYGRAFLAWWRADSRRRQSGNVNEARQVYFFSVPLTGISISLACYVASIALSRVLYNALLT